MPQGSYLPRLQGEELAELESRLTDKDKPYLVGFGPAEFSASLELESWPSLIWDVNGYYRELGVSPKAGKLELRRAYQRLEGWNSRRLTMILNILLDPVRRLLYDLAPFDSIYVDSEVQGNLRRKAVEDAATAMARGEELRDEDLAKPEDYKITAEQLQDAMTREMQRDLQQQIGSWSFYLWRTQNRDMGQFSRLAQWRAMLAVAMAKYYDGPPLRLSVGFHSGDSDAALCMVGYRVVIFLNEKVQPSDVIACMAVAELIRHQQANQLTEMTGVQND